MYHPSAVDLDGTNDYFTLATDLTATMPVGKQGLVSLWFRIDGGDGTNRYVVANNATRFYIVLGTDNKFTIYGATSAGAAKLILRSNTAIAASTTWHHLMASWNLATTVDHLYIDGTDDERAGGTNLNANIDYSRTGWDIGKVGANLWDGALSDFYCNIGNAAADSFLDLSVAGNRAKFYDSSSSNKAVDLGSDGSTPTSYQPRLYMKFASGAEGTNSGSGYDFTAVGAPAYDSGPIAPRNRSRAWMAQMLKQGRL